MTPMRSADRPRISLRVDHCIGTITAPQHLRFTRANPGPRKEGETHMAQRPSLTTEAGAPVIDNQNSQTAGVSGPVLLQDHYLIEKLARFNRERIPERVVHAVGSGAYGYLEVTDQGIRCLTSPEAEIAGGKDPAFLQKDLYEAIGRGDFPSWTLKVQVMREQNASSYRFNPFDLTKVWPYRDYPLVPIARLVLNRVPDNYFADVEQAAFDPANFVPGIGPSPDRMLQARLFAYGDAHRYRLGINHTRLPVNAPRGVDGGARNYGPDGAMRFDAKGARAKNYEPNSFGEPVQTSEAYEHGLPLSGTTGPPPRAGPVGDDGLFPGGEPSSARQREGRQPPHAGELLRARRGRASAVRARRGAG